MEPLGLPDDTPLRDCSPGVWPTLGDCRKARTALASASDEEPTPADYEAAPLSDVMKKAGLEPGEFRVSETVERMIEPKPTAQDHERARAACKHLAPAGPIGAPRVHPRQCRQCDSTAAAIAEARADDKALLVEAHAAAVERLALIREARVEIERLTTALAEARTPSSPASEPAPGVREALRLLKSVKLQTPADGCVICRHKDREHNASFCDTCAVEGTFPVCGSFVPVADVDRALAAALSSASEPAPGVREALEKIHSEIVAAIGKNRDLGVSDVLAMIEDHLDALSSVSVSEAVPSASQPEPVALDSVLRDTVVWGCETFPDATPASCAAHLYKEARELKANPTDAEEVADVLMLVAHLSHHAGIDMAEAVRAKLAVVRTREWGEPDADGVIEHIRAPAPREGE
jgi:NTP pyrophosphatase (non-canonical NTP hydrolase)